MIKKLKLISVLFSTMVLLPFSSLVVSCKRTKETGNSSVVSVSKNDEENTLINEKIKDFIKDSFYGNRDASILALDELQENMDLQTKNDLEKYLSQLNDKLKEFDMTNVQLTNQIIIQGLKNRIIKNCDEVNKELKDTNGEFAEEFKEVGHEKILEVNEDEIVFNLKKFNLSEILDSYNEDDESELSSSKKSELFANSENLKIYNFSTNLHLTLNYGAAKKNSIKISDYNLFIVLDKKRTMLLTDGISKYLENRISENSKNMHKAIPIYLNEHDTDDTKKYFTEIFEKSNFDLTDQKNKREIERYLAMFYLPKIVFKDNDKENGIKVLRKSAHITEDDKNIVDLNINSQTSESEQINFLNLFGDDLGSKKITDAILENNIKIENFLTNHQTYSYKNNNYYLLGTGTMEVKRWIINGFSLNPIKFTFKIFIKDYMLKEQVDDLKTCLKHLTDIMADSKAEKRNGSFPSPTDSESSYTEKYTVNIEIPKKYLDLDIVKKVFIKPEPWSELANILNALFIERTREAIDSEIGSNFNFKFTTLTNILRFRVSNAKKEKNDYYSDSGEEFVTLDKPINIYFVFNSFKINLTNDLFLKRRKVNPYTQKRWNRETKAYKNVEVNQDGNKILFR